MRKDITDAVLALLVEEQLQVRTLSQSDFTAYDITCDLRRRCPHLQIRHDRTRAFVHQYMASLLAAGSYQASLRSFGGDTAILYEPPPIWVGGQDSGTRPAPPIAPLSLN